jgi:hypothetical protein
MLRSTRKVRDSAAAWKASDVPHRVDSSRMREPSGWSHISVTSRRPRSPCGGLELEDEDRPEDREVVDRGPRRRVLGVERTLLFGEQLAQRLLASDRCLDAALLDDALERRRADVPARDGVDLGDQRR